MNAGIFNVPTELANGPTNATQAMSLIDNIVQIIVSVGRLVQP